MRRSVCIITPGHLASAPRVVKEADALGGAGYRVHVVAGRHYAPVEPLEAALLAAAKWTYTRIDYRRGLAVLARKVLRHFARHMLARTPLAGTALVARAQHAESLHLGAVAARVPADLYIGHCLAGLPAAARAASARHARYGFDAEDLHEAETLEAMNDPVARRLPGLLQSRLLPGAAHLTAAAPLIASELSRVYGVRPTIVLNTFPLAQAPKTPVDPGPITAESPARIYWFSQTIGPGRGLESAITMLAQVKTPVVLQLRGFVSDRYRANLVARALTAGLARPIEFLAPAAPAEMARLAAGAHLGLSIEESTPRNHDVCLANKIFVYLLAGVPQLLTPTSGQRALAPELGDAALLLDLAAPVATAAALDTFFTNPPRYAAARHMARTLASRRFSWDVEQATFLDSVGRALELS